MLGYLDRVLKQLRDEALRAGCSPGELALAEAQALAHLGDPAQALARIAEAADAGAEPGPVALRRAEALFLSGHRDEAAAATREALHRLKAETQRRARSEALLLVAGLAVEIGDRALAERSFQGLFELAHRYLPDLEVRAWSLLAREAYGTQRDVVTGQRAATNAIDLAERAAPLPWLALIDAYLARRVLGSCLRDRGDLVEARGQLEVALAFLKGTGVPRHVEGLEQELSDVLRATGEPPAGNA
jgi:tetratricopeptide (TPR) repeat protein